MSWIKKPIKSFLIFEIQSLLIFLLSAYEKFSAIELPSAQRSVIMLIKLRLARRSALLTETMTGWYKSDSQFWRTTHFLTLILFLLIVINRMCAAQRYPMVRLALLELAAFPAFVLAGNALGSL